MTRSNVVRVLDDTVVNQIAAGEVVERPASVVKELVENSLDAGASEISISIINGGKSSLEIIDNGTGMSKNDALLAIERFGTSKISSIDDLFSVATLGFRGEALPSIASVSRMKLCSSTDGESGVVLSISGGSLRDVSQAQLPKGTRIEVKNLFYNVPARKKFLRGETTETGQIKALLADFAVANPQIRFRLIVDGKESALYPCANSFFERVQQLGLAGSNMLEIDKALDAPWGQFEIKAMLSHPVGSLSSAGKLRILVNRRSVRERLILGAVREGFGNFLKAGKYPSGVIQIEIDPRQVDVNVHPQKSEVRFREGNVVFGLISSAIREEFSSVNPQALATEVSSARPFTTSETSLARPTEITWGREAQPQFQSPSQPQPSPYSQPQPNPKPISQMRYLGQIMDLYLLFEDKGKLVIVDMHAAHERVQFYRLKSQLKEGSVKSQGLLMAETITLPADRISELSHILPALGRLGIDCEQFGDDAIIVRSTPAILGSINICNLLEDIFALPVWGDPKSLIEAKIDAAISTLACHGSVRRGRQMEPEEAYRLLEQLELAENSAFCPHGRPVVVFMNEDELEKLFGRSGF